MQGGFGSGKFKASQAHIAGTLCRRSEVGRTNHGANATEGARIPRMSLEFTFQGSFPMTSSGISFGLLPLQDALSFVVGFFHPQTSVLRAAPMVLSM
jgi:hypothetical protein